jgi:hypothetical protein
MTQPEAKAVQILFHFYSDILEQEMEETIWGVVADENNGYYQLDSIPFYVNNVATDDLVHAEYDDTEEMLSYSETIQPSGNSTIWVVITDDDTDIDDIRTLFDKLDCLSEALSNRFFAMEIKAQTNYLHVRNKLNELKSEGLIDYSEPCLSAQHQY